MHQIKIFKGLESEIPVLEGQVNKWLAESSARVINIFGNIAPQSRSLAEKETTISKSPFAASDIIMIVHYEQS